METKTAGGAVVTPTMSDADHVDTRKLETLVDDWEQSARRKFADAEREQSEFGRRFIEHGAMCYFNCAQALREALDVALPRPSPKPTKRQKQHHQRA